MIRVSVLLALQASAIKEISAATAREKGAQLASNNKIKELEEQLRALQKKYDDLFRPKPKPLKPVGRHSLRGCM